MPARNTLVQFLAPIRTYDCTALQTDRKTDRRTTWWCQ